ncbi:MAG: hypothetical protein ABI824_19735, partial [Acidobacteriota bacterium]
MRIAKRRQQDQSGFVLLLVFLMAASIAMMLYIQLPRYAFESEREKEQLLIDRGEQYIRAITLFRQATGGYPATIAALEDTNNKRYLRRKYKDPYTGKDEWRLVHSNGTQLTDSLVEKPPDVNGQSATTTASTTTQDQGPTINAAALQRPSDTTLPNGQNFSGFGASQGQAALNGQLPPGVVQGPNSFPGQNGQNLPNQPGFGLPGGLPNGIALPGGAQTSGAFQPQFPGQQFAGQQFPG